MPAIPLLSGITAKETAEFVTSLPVNLEPIVVDSGISKGQLRSASGATTWAQGPGPDRGGILFNNVVHRVMGTNLVSVSQAGVVTVLGNVGGSDAVTLDYGFGRLAIASNGNLFYWDSVTLTQVTDPDLGTVVDMKWFDGYYVTTDGTNVVTTQLSDPTSVLPGKYGAPDQDPSPVTGLGRIRNELYVFQRDVTSIFNDVGGSGFPLQENPGATIPLGCVGAHAKCKFQQTLAFVGGGRNQAPGVYTVGGGTASKLSTRVVDDLIAAVPNQGAIVLESRMMRGDERLLVRLPTQTLVYLPSTSQAAGEPIWYVLASGRAMDQAYRPINAVYAYGKWVVGDAASGAIGVLDDNVASHFGDSVGWRFDTGLVYNQAKGGIVHDLELVGLPGRGGEDRVMLSFTRDGETYTTERAARTGALGSRNKRVTWSPHRPFRSYMGMRFRGSSDALAGFAALEANVEPLNA